jgi:3'-phosphoadenosine 5'-phosphosulfate sulfotransferase (PAPS reductase)/FAD synthetase
MPLESYDLFIVLFSGGKDSTAAYYRMIELGVPKNRIEIWHHDVDGFNATRRIDWPVTKAYIESFAEAEGVRLRISYREFGFWGELFRIGASRPVYYEDGGRYIICPLSDHQKLSMELRAELGDRMKGDQFDRLKALGYRYKFPAKSGDLSRRWCSAYLKIVVGDTVIRNLEKTKANVKCLVVSGERREESANRAKYNEIELHETHADVRAKRIVHRWRNIIDYSELDVWDTLKRWKVNPHPAYIAGWNRCSCAMCIFGLPAHWAGIRELFPNEYKKFCQDEIELGFTLDNKKSLSEYVGAAKSCVSHSDKTALLRLVSGEYSPDFIYTKDKEWKLPAGALRGAMGGPC